LVGVIKEYLKGLLIGFSLRIKNADAVLPHAVRPLSRKSWQWRGYYTPICLPNHSPSDGK
jgi:hypothetical protein